MFNKKSALYWANIGPSSEIPATAVRGGFDEDQNPIYVGSVIHNGCRIPVKAIPKKGGAFLCVEGKEIVKSEYQILCEKRIEWVHASKGVVPPGAIVGGKTINGEPLYIARARHAGYVVTVGKLQVSSKVCHIGYAGKEHACEEYEVLVAKE
ncbi:uncharacterized protein LOC132699810 [Cylas formicarius]|uniref:uncharacterized protein LOC132699810 n=1 Tax=Cylas formicarius TaxID=197179 RepID=UPI002958D748|nr:uncharacterized protein LOC132699810 [Cylas formicarius]